MGKLSKLTALLLTAALTAGLTGPAVAADVGSYTDVPEWAEEYVAEVTEKSLIDGRSGTVFGAGEAMTRAELVTALYRLAGSPGVKGADNPFTDVEEDADCRDAVVWAFDQKIISGIGEGTFDPNGSVKRQEIAKIICEFAARQAGKDSLTSPTDELSAYPDDAEVSGWARDYMNWAVASRFIIGDENRLLHPNGTATRAEVSAILCRYMADAARGDPGSQGGAGIEVEPNPENPDGREKLADGVYTIHAECEQSMFKIDRCILTVKDGAMTAELVLASESFDKMFTGTASAAKLDGSGAVDGVKDSAGNTVFTLPVAELDKPLDYASHSVKNDKWYDRTLTFLADTAQAE